MKPSNPHKSRKQIRLRDYDYCQNGAYFITICVNKFKCLFGKIVEGEVILNEGGKIVERFWLKLPKKFNNIILDEFIIMPNHFHGIIIIDNEKNNVGADPCVRPYIP